MKKVKYPPPGRNGIFTFFEESLFARRMNEGFMLPSRRRFTSKERRTNAELEYARVNWLSAGEMDMRQVHKLKRCDPEMRWLSELFPLEEGRVARKVAEQRFSEWCVAHPDDARALAHLATIRGDDSLMEKAASMGDARAMAKVFFSSRSDGEKFQLACASAEKGDAFGTYCLMHCFRAEIGCKKNESFAEELLERAADLGSVDVCYDLARNREMKPWQRVKLLISFFGMYFSGSGRLYFDLEEVFRRYATDGSCTDVIFEVGEMFKGSIDVERGMVFGRKHRSNDLDILLRAVGMYDRWCDVAREACVAWILIAKRIGVHKDVRRIIAKMVWEARREGRGNPLSKEAKKEARDK